MDSFLKKKPAFFIVDGDIPFLDALLTRASKVSQKESQKKEKVPGPVVSVAVFSGLSRLSKALQTVGPYAASSRILVQTKPLEPITLAKSILFLVGYSDCAQALPHAPPGAQPSSSSSLSPHHPHPMAPVLRVDDIFQLPSSPHNPLTLDVLVVEDDRVSQMLLQRILEQFNLRFRITPSGDEALEIWKASLSPIPLIFMDVEVEGTLNGLQVTNEIRVLENQNEQERDEAGMPPRARSYVVVTTGRAMESDKLEAHDKGCDEFRTKPLNLEAIRQIIRSKLPIPELRT